MSAMLECPTCGTKLEAKDERAAAMVKDCVDHPAPNLREVSKRQGQCTELDASLQRCELDDGHWSAHRIGELEWVRYDKWNRWCVEELSPMKLPEDT